MPARKPTATLEMSGAFVKNPNRQRTGEPDSGRGIGPAPEHMTPEQAAIWDEIVGDLAPGLLKSSDRQVFGWLVTLVTEFRRDPEGFGGRKWMVMVSLSGRFGMTPVDRSRLCVPAKSDDKPKSGLASFRR